MKKIGLLASLAVIISALIGSAVWVSYYLNSQNQIDPEASEASSVYTGLSRFAAGRSAEMFVGSTELMDDYAFGWMFNWGSEKTTYLAAQGLQYKFPDSVEFMAVFGGWGPTSTSCDSSTKAVISKLDDFSYVTIGNEIGWDDKSDPTTYATRYKTWYDCIKSVNPTLLVAPGANPGNPAFRYGSQLNTWVISSDPTGRWNPSMVLDYYKYLDFVRAEYTRLFGVLLPQDYYVIHLYAMGDWHNITAQRNRILDFRRYMKENGHQKLDLIIKEIGLPNEETDSVKNGNTMMATLEMLNKPTQSNAIDDALGNPLDNNRLVQKWAWFVAVSRPTDWQTTNFMICPQAGKQNYDTDCTLAGSSETSLGRKYRDYIASIKSQQDVSPPSTIEILIRSIISRGFEITLNANDDKGVNNYSYAVGSQEGKSDLVAWSNLGKINKIEIANSFSGKYISVRARDDGFNWSSVYSKQLSIVTPGVSSTASPTSTPTISPTISPSISVSPTVSASPVASVTPDTKVQEAITKADLDINGKVGVEDFVLFLEYYKAGNVKIDYNADGKVVRDINDFVYFIDYYKTYNDYY